MNRMDEYIEEYIRKGERYGNKTFARGLLTGKNDYAFTSQYAYYDMDSLEENIRNSVRKYTRDKDAAIDVYKGFVNYLQRKGIPVQVGFPPIPISNSFERQMFIAKYLHDPSKKISDLEDILWVSSRTIEGDLNKLRDEDGDPIQICGKKFCIRETERHRGRITSASTVHPLFLTLNLTQVIVTLKGLRKMSEDPLYKGYAMTAAADIWEQLSDYAKKRIHTVLGELLPEDLSWYESLEKQDGHLFYTERDCSSENVFLDCLKNGKTFCAEVDEGDRTVLYTGCKIQQWGNRNSGIEMDTDQGRVTVMKSSVLRSAYTIEGLLK